MENEEIIRKAVRQVQLNILIKLDEICRKNGLHYYLACGTCLGALRHKGFIPWDDDIDVFMSYPDTRRLIRLQSQFGEKYFVQCKDTDPDYRSIAMRIRDCDTTCIEEDEVDLRINKGIYLDIYPFYECSNNRLIRIIDILRSNLLKVLVNNRPPINHGKVLALASKGVLFLVSEKKRLEWIKNLEKRLTSVKGNEVVTYYGGDITLFTAIAYKKEWFMEPKKKEFEGLLFDCPSEPEKYLEKRYGNFMELPPINDQVVHHTYVRIDPYKSYKEYEDK